MWWLTTLLCIEIVEIGIVGLIENVSSFWQSGLTLNSEGILGPLTSDLPAEGLDLSEIPPADD